MTTHTQLAHYFLSFYRLWKFPKKLFRNCCGGVFKVLSPNAQYQSTELHWLNVPERVEYKPAVTVHWCLENKAPRYLVECCTPVADVASRHRRSANLHRLTVPWYGRSTIGRRAFSVGGPSVWNSLSVELREPTVSCRDFHRTLKTIFFARY